MPNQPSPKKRSLPLFFVLAFGFSWLLWLPPVLSSYSLISLPVPSLVWVMAGAHGPLFAALVLTGRAGGWVAVKSFLRSGFNLRMAPIWWLIILLLPVLLAGLSVWLNVLLNNYQPDLTLLRQPWMILPVFLYLFFLGGSVQEEYGWRGYALPGLLEKYSPLLASMLLGLFWGLWHLPLFHISGISQAYLPLGVFILLAVAFSLPYTWIYLRTRRNLFSALLFNSAINLSLSLFPPVEQKAGLGIPPY